MIETLFLFWGPVVVWAGLIFYLSSIPHLTTGLGIIDTILRKGAHITEYGVLFLLFVRALRRTWTNWAVRKYVIWGILFCLCYAISDEYHQHFVPGRVGAPRDVMIDMVGTFIGVILFKFKMETYGHSIQK